MPVPVGQPHITGRKGERGVDQQEKVEYVGEKNS